MDQEMNFPNPVARHDLPTRRRRWPRVLLGLGVLGLLTVVFLPQILSSKVGRKFVVSYISSKANCPVTLESFNTSWFGGTTVRFLTIYDPMSRHMGFKSLTCQASLWNLLRGKYKLGDTVIEGLNIDYVVDDGRGGDSFAILKGPPTEAAGGGALPQVSGKITVNSGTITLFRGTVQPKLFNVTWEQAKLQDLDASFDIAALDRPWTYTLSAETVEDGVIERGTITSSGTVTLGGAMKVDLTVGGEKIRTGPLGAALIPGATASDVRQALGPVLAKIDVAVKGADGKFNFERCDATSEFAQIHLKPTIDTTVTPAVLAIGMGTEAGTISTGVSKRLAAGGLVYLNPFFREAMDGQGNVTLSVEQLRVPLAKQWTRTMTAKGRVVAKGVRLDRKDEMSMTETLPDNVASQLSLLTGDAEKSVVMDVDGSFSISDGNVVISATRTTLRDTTLMIEGTTELDGGAIRLMAGLANAPSITSIIQNGAAAIAIPIGGTVLKPQLSVLNLKGDLSDASLKSVNEQINQQITRMRAKETQRLMQKSQNQVQEILRPLQGPK